MSFHAGEVWEYQTRDEDEGSTVRVLLVEPDCTGRDVAHVEVRQIKVHRRDGTTYKTDVGHLPIAVEHLARSVTKLVSGAAPVAIPDGYEIWREAHQKREAGVFGISMAEAVQCVDETIRQ